MQKLTEAQLDDMAELAHNCYDPGQLDWEDLIDRAERLGIAEFSENMLHPEIRRMKNYVRKALREMRA